MARPVSIQCASATAPGSSGDNGVTLHPGPAEGAGHARASRRPSPPAPTWPLGAEGRSPRSVRSRGPRWRLGVPARPLLSRFSPSRSLALSVAALRDRPLVSNSDVSYVNLMHV